ncbi:uncharacterized protein Z520_09302 [Fonsecaea multimorphosa CBS 102226]|uniref:SRR1-like domain-containing protein n=1 Tax=Fonsecaea multimorphosa CBS 102226 TaxID=1442371 RepID=A0A0D2JNU4_9EURO|nr:uncharacterized protein Z520_09302 [Fonsecaea multimorphosa CBS 102226]KIX94992.1 hypothetical protein Z520_09302 [Fonsecaea multimorphosa CBS 102226]OAL20641.1 hypothetical protein AYO22_08650 [Fonsecaea multimorphosa]
MPHTSRKKKGHHSKRREIVDNDGWTRITSSSSTPLTIELDPTKSEPEQVPKGSTCAPSLAMDLPVLPPPMPAAKGSTLETMRAQFARIEARWRETDLCKKLEEMLRYKILTGGCNISYCAVFGTGSFCGDAVHWIDRHESAYFQLAAFQTVVKSIERMQGHVLQVYAQEPYYNELDALFLAGFNITKVDHPKGFELLDRDSFAYSPAAEAEVERQIISRAPQIWLHRSIDHSLEGDKSTSSETRDQFKMSHEHAVLPELDLKNFPFHGSVLWWRRNDDRDESMQAS